jgi:hypothetical protein
MLDVEIISWGTKRRNPQIPRQIVMKKEEGSKQVAKTSQEQRYRSLRGVNSSRGQNIKATNK